MPLFSHFLRTDLHCSSLQEPPPFSFQNGISFFPSRYHFPPSLFSFSSLMSFFGSFLLLLFSLSCSLSQPLFSNPCGEKCGTQIIPFPFHLNSSCGPPIKVFKLSCSPTSSLYLTLGHTDFRIIVFLSSGSLILDYTLNTSSSSSSLSRSCDRWYANLILSSLFNRNPFFGITSHNVLRLYDCEDSSLCHSSCGLVGMAGGCDVNNRTDFGCCYPLSDGSVWKSGNDFSVFGEYGCRGFSSWAINQSTAVRGIEMEWAFPRKNGIGIECADGAVLVNATAVNRGVRCTCGTGFVGDGYMQGAGCYRDELCWLISFLRICSVQYNLILS